MAPSASTRIIAPRDSLLPVRHLRPLLSAALLLPLLAVPGSARQHYIPVPAPSEEIGRIVVGLPDPVRARGLLTQDESGELEGFGRRLLERAAASVGLELEFRRLPRGTGEQELAEGELDALCPLSVTHERVSQFAFSTPILIANGAVFFRRGELPPSSLEEVGQRRIVVAQYGIAHQFCIEKSLPFETASTLEEAMRRVVDGRADCLITTQIAGRSEAERLGLAGLVDQTLDEDRLWQAFAVAVRRADGALLARLDYGLALVRDSGEWDRLYEEWVEPYQPSLQDRSALPLVVVGLLVAICAALVVLVVMRMRLTSSTRALDESERLNRLVAESLPALVCSAFVGSDGRRELRFANSHLDDWRARFPDFDPADPHSILFDVHPDDRQRYGEILARRTRIDTEIRLRSASGRYHWLHSVATPIATQGGVLWHCLLLDTTSWHEAQEERHRLELQLADAQRLESLGSMAGGVAHDFNNLLMDVQGNVELALEAAGSHDAHLQAALASTRRAAERIRRLVASAGEAHLVEERVDLGDAVREAATVFTADEGARLRVRLELPEEGPFVRGDPVLLEQVVRNLIENAAEALSDESAGCVRVRLRALSLSDEALEDYSPRRPPGEYAELLVEDDGCGMDEDTQRRMFDPFFSTKFVGRGLGLGHVHRTVLRHEGSLHVRSAPGEGTAVSVLLPLATRRPSSGEHELRPFRPRTALVIDDEDAVRRVTCSLLESCGWTTRSACEAEEALALLRVARPSVVLLDLSMPGIDGLGILRLLRDEAPTQPIVLMSGYSEHEVDVMGLGAVGFVSKPFTRDELTKTLEEALWRADGAQAPV